MTLDWSMAGKAFEVFIEQFLVPNLWKGAVVVMDNLPAHKLAAIEPFIESAGATILNLSPYSPDFNPIELWWSQPGGVTKRSETHTEQIVERLVLKKDRRDES